MLTGTDQRSLLPASPVDGTVDLDTGYEAWIHGLPATPPEVAVAPDDVVLQLYSSGTTGMSKGARLTHANLMFTPRMGRECYEMNGASVNLLASPLFHIGGTGYALTAMGQGATHRADGGGRPDRDGAVHRAAPRHARVLRARGGQAAARRRGGCGPVEPPR